MTKLGFWVQPDTSPCSTRPGSSPNPMSTSCITRMSKDMSDEMARTQDGLQEAVQPIVDRVTQLSADESKTAAAVEGVSNDVAKIKLWISTVDEREIRHAR
ncbi:hypothetical protein FN846DRAFT_1019382 [Sphaerosporella brunnea]|uniref:Uncharacterized protein n=1 Tax=Sphaerosporella brunnea TaxID=1250544 RepID=A0A5J5F5M7_9PEZI|nr:hypothetical protein FN846DRAFT_1019382 [Sphaerosporella brunnea]